MTTATDTPLALLLSDDLMFTSRITGTARDLGLMVKVARTPEVLLSLARQQTPRCVLLDLANPGLVLADFLRQLAEVCNPLPRLVAYGSHVDTETLRAARAAGCDLVLPRSKFVEELPKALTQWLE
jgi:DNA-binding NarL/FixJ family response regulator